MKFTDLFKKRKLAEPPKIFHHKLLGINKFYTVENLNLIYYDKKKLV